jgi:hypothetical protein
MTPQVRRIDPASPIYQEFARLYRAARQIRPSGVDRWNGELLARDDDVWGSVNPKTGTMALSQHRVLPYLTGSRSLTHPGRQAQALQTVLHEAYHLRVPVDAPSEPNAFRGFQSKALDEGLTEYQAANDVAALADRAEYGQLTSSGHAYPGAYEATVQLLDYAAYPGGDRDRLAQRALDQPVVMRWDTIADEILRTRLSSIVPPHPDHQRAVRATLIKAMAHPTWEDLHHRGEIAGCIAAHHTKVALDTAIEGLRQHYDFPAPPFPTALDQRALEVARQESLTLGVAQKIDPALQAAFSGHVPAAHAVRVTPSLGDGSRRRTYSPSPTGRSTKLPTGRENN